MKNRCICVTGATQGIGYGIAESFAKAGARLVINAHVPDSSGAADRLGDLTECHFIQADVSSAAGAETLVAAAKDKLGRIDTLVCNAGTIRDHAFLDLTEADFDATFNLNVKGQLFCAQAFVRHLEPGQQGPGVICIGSTNGLQAEKDSVIYDASKGAVLMLVRSMAVTLAPLGVRVNGLAPGLVETPLTAPGLSRGRTREVISNQIPLGRIGLPGDIGGAAVFLASEEARYITGQMLYIDGGIVANQISWEDKS